MSTQNKYADNIKNLNIPILFIHGNKDSVLPSRVSVIDTDNCFYETYLCSIKNNYYILLKYIMIKNNYYIFLVTIF